METLNEEIRNKIVEYIKTTKMGASSSEISKNIGHNRVTISKYLEVMKAHGVLKYEDVAQAKLWNLCDKKEKPTILIVDDEPHVINLVKLSLQIGKFNILEANSGMEALEKVRDFNPDLIVLDLMMPGMNGFEVCKTVKGNPLTQKIPIIILSAKSQLDDKMKGIDCGADDYIIKPFDPLELEARINMVLRNLDSEGQSHPLTELPTDAALVDNIQQRLLVDQSFIVYGINVSNLDSFKKEMGCKKIEDLYTILKRMLEKTLNDSNSFLGQLMNDTLVVVTNISRFEKKLQESFTESLPYIYNGSKTKTQIALNINKVPNKDLANKKVSLSDLPNLLSNK